MRKLPNSITYSTNFHQLCHNKINCRTLTSEMAMYSISSDNYNHLLSFIWRCLATGTLAVRTQQEQQQHINNKDTAKLEQDTDRWIQYKKLTLTGLVKTRRSSCLEERLLLSCGHVLYMKSRTLNRKLFFAKDHRPTSVNKLTW